VITDGMIESRSKNTNVVNYEIREQIKFLVGQLENAAINVNMYQLRVSLDLNSGVETEYGTFLYSYAAQIPVVWPRDKDWPIYYSVALPKSGDTEGKEKFFARYSSECTESIKSTTSKNFYFKINLETNGCKLSGPEVDKNIVFKTDLTLIERYKELSLVYPNYSEIWKDKEIGVSAIFESDFSPEGEKDKGFKLMKEVFDWTVSTYGEPKKISIDRKPSESLLPNQRHIVAVFQLPNGRRLNLQLLLIDSLNDLQVKYEKIYRSFTKTSDVISYSGQHPIGTTTRYLAKLGEYEIKKYQVFQINGQDNFAYFDYSLQVAHKSVSSEESSTKYFDLISTSHPRYERANSFTTTSLISAFMGSQSSYLEIVRQMQRVANVSVAAE